MGWSHGGHRGMGRGHRKRGGYVQGRGGQGVRGSGGRKGNTRPTAKAEGRHTPLAPYLQYKFLSMTEGMGLISVLSSCSILYRENLSSYVMRLIARPR